MLLRKGMPICHYRLWLRFLKYVPKPFYCGQAKKLHLQGAGSVVQEYNWRLPVNEEDSMQMGLSHNHAAGHQLGLLLMFQKQPLTRRGLHECHKGTKRGSFEIFKLIFSVGAAACVNGTLSISCLATAALMRKESKDYGFEGWILERHLLHEQLIVMMMWILMYVSINRRLNLSNDMI